MKLNQLRSELSTLPNGLRVVAIQLPGVHSTFISAQLNVGSRFENESNNGLSHFLEHMVYRGTPSFPSAHELALRFESLGGTLMASTAADTGAMDIRIPPSNLEPVLEVLAEVIRLPLFDGIDIERWIVSEEILEGLDDEGKCVDADNLIRAAVFPGHPLGMPITGTLKHVKSFTCDALREHHARFYTAKNMVVAVVGPSQPEVMLRAVDSYFSGLPVGCEMRGGDAPEPARQSFVHIRHSSSQTQLRVGFRAPAWNAKQEPAMELLMRLLDDGMSTRLYHRICDQQGLCYDVSGHYETYADSGLVELEAESAHPRAPLVLEQLLGIVRELRDQVPPDQEVEIAKRRHRWRLEQLPDEPGEVAEFFALEELSGSRQSPYERQALIETLTPADIQLAAQTWFTAQNLSVVAVGAPKKAAVRRMEQLVSEFGKD